MAVPRRIFKTRVFSKWARRVGMRDADLWEAVEEMARGLVDASLGGHLLKKRIRLPGRGRRGGARTIVATNLGTRWFFLLGFAKNERDNIENSELRPLEELANELLLLTDDQLDVGYWSMKLEEVRHEGESETR